MLLLVNDYMSHIAVDWCFVSFIAVDFPVFMRCGGYPDSARHKNAVLRGGKYQPLKGHSTQN